MKIASTIAALFLFAASAFAGTGKVTLAWDPITDPTVTEVKVYFGTASGVYGTPIVLTIVPPATTLPTQTTVPNLNNGATYFFAITAVALEPDSSLLESLFSNEVSTKIPFAPPAAPTNLKITNTAAK